ncbi:hypothetical protein BCR32DRAFT_249575 [Anaeromyces robustus]|uniref:Uncharacterized protein n=1 Tax=Anaeromyces robustus TaxID=1754192 RepID=A0A1Y1WPW0_9FUNG|nr:hypothetical protein BCR32DRAFT_249575 [Anaeromyces robustus]|eukprot:ORX75415.1 hypothetical protein BCR32DRAFT_249575 [Anaeromyces robustus]
MSISDFEQSLWELALLINPTHLANITTSKLNSYYQDTILDMRKVVLVQNLFNDIYNNWTDHQIRYQQNRRRQIENGEITEQQLLEEESEENESEIEYISDEDNQEMMDEERYDSVEYSVKQEQLSVQVPIQVPVPVQVPVVEEENKENIDNNSGGVIIAGDNTVIKLPVRKSSVSHKTNGKPIKPSIVENQPIVDNNKKIEQNIVPSTPMTKTNSKDTINDKNTNINKSPIMNSNVTQAPIKEMNKKSYKNGIVDNVKEQKPIETKENVKQITLDFSGKDAMSSENNNKKTNENASNEKEQKSKSKEHRRKKIEREPRKDSLKANVKLLDEKSSNEVFKELQKSGVITTEKEDKFYKKSPKLDSSISLDEKTESSINSVSSSNTSSNNSFVIRSFNIPSQNSSSSAPSSATSSAPSSPQFKAPLNTNKPLPAKQDPIPVRKSSSFKKNKPTYRLSDKEVSIKDKYKLNKSSKDKESSKESKNKKPLPEQPKVHLRPKKITNNDPSMPPTMQRRSMDELLFQFADVMDIVSLIPHIVGDDDLLGNDLTFNSSNLNSKVQAKDKDGNIIEEPVRRRPSRAPTPPPTVVSNGKEYEVYSIPSERHQKYIKKKEEMEKKNKRRSSLKFEYHGFEDLKKQQELAGYDVTGDIPITEKIAKEKELAANKNNNVGSNQPNYKKSNNNSSSGCGATMKMDVLSGCMLSSSDSSSNSHSKSSSSKRASRFLNSLTKSKNKSGSKDKDKEKNKDKSSNKENISSNKNYLVRRKSTDKSSSNVRSYQRYKLGSNQDSTSPQPSPTLSSASMNSSSSSVRKSYSSTTLSKYDLPHMSSLTNDSSSRRYGSNSNGKTNLTTSKSSPGLYEINLSSSSSNSSSKQHRKKATDNKSSSTSEIDKFFDNVFRIDWSL